MLDHENVIELFQALDFHLIKFFEFALHFHLQKWMRLLEKWLRLTIDYTPETLTWPLENDGWKTTHSPFGIGPFSRAKCSTSRDSHRKSTWLHRPQAMAGSGASMHGF